MQQLVNHLETLGFHKTEASLYIAGLGFTGSVSVTELQAATGIKRPTIYHNLSLLQERGMVSVAVSQRGNRYIFSEPLNLEHSVQAEVRQAKTKLRTLCILMDELAALQPKSSDTPLVRHFQGIQGVRTVVDMALFCKQPTWKVIAPLHNFFREFDESYARYYVATRKRHGIQSRTLWEQPDPDGRPLTSQELAEREPRYLPESMRGSFESTIIMFDDKVAIISPVDSQSAVLLESKEFASLFGALFEGLWSASTPYQTQ